MERRDSEEIVAPWAAGLHRGLSRENFIPSTIDVLAFSEFCRRARCIHSSARHTCCTRLQIKGSESVFFNFVTWIKRPIGLYKISLSFLKSPRPYSKLQRCGVRVNFTVVDSAPGIYILKNAKRDIRQKCFTYKSKKKGAKSFNHKPENEMLNTWKLLMLWASY